MTHIPKHLDPVDILIAELKKQNAALKQCKNTILNLSDNVRQHENIIIGIVEAINILQGTEETVEEFFERLEDNR